MAMVISPFVIGYRVRKQKGHELISFFYRVFTVVFMSVSRKPGGGGDRVPPGTHSVCRTRAKGRPSEARPRAAPGRPVAV